MFPGEAAALAAASPVFTDERIMKRFIRYFLKWTALFLLGSVLAFLLVRMMPVSPVEQALTRDRLPQTAENIAYMEHRMGLDQPLPSQYISWLLRFVSGNWGESLVSGADIKAQFIRKMPYSFSIGILGLLLASVAAFGIGYRAAVRGQGFCDRASAALAVFSQSVPSFITAVVLIYFLGVRFHLVRFFTGTPLASVLTAILLSALYLVGNLSRVVRKAFLEEKEASYVRFSVARGFAPEYVLLHHASRPVLCRLLSVLMANFAWVFGGSTVLEFAFGIPGISFFLVESMKARDYSVLQTYIMMIMLWMFAVHLVMEGLLLLLDIRNRGEDYS